MLDFIVQDHQSENAFIIEVKSRESDELKFKDLPKNFPYEHAFAVLVVKKHINCTKIPVSE